MARVPYHRILPDDRDQLLGGLCARFDGDDPDLAALREWAPTYRREAWAGALEEHGVEDAELVGEMAAAFPGERLSRRVVFPEVEPILSELRARYRLGLVTNGAPDLQRAKLRHSGLEGYFDVVLVSGEVGAGKPDPRIFHAALHLLGCLPEQALMVGDNTERDILGAESAGIRAIWLNRNGAGQDRTGAAHEQITDLYQLLDLALRSQ